MKLTASLRRHFPPVLLLIAMNGLTCMTGAPYGFIGAFYDMQGLTKPQIGLLLSATAITSIFIQPLWAKLSDQTGRRKAVLGLVTTGSMFSVLGYYLARGFSGYLLAAFLYAVFHTALGPLSDALVVEQAGKIGANFGRVRLSGTIGYAVVVYLVGLLLANNIQRLFLISSILYVLMLGLVLCLPPDPKKQKKSASGAIQPKQSFKGQPLFTGNRIGFVLVFALVCFIGLSFYGAFFSIYLLEIGYSETVLGLANSIAALSEIPVLLVISKHLKKWDTIQLLTFSGILLAVRLLLVPTGWLPLLLVGQMMGGLTMILLYYVCVIYLSEHASEGRQSQAQSVYALITGGFGSAIGQIGGGFLVQLVGLRMAYLLVAVGVFLAVGANFSVYRLYKKRGWRFLVRGSGQAAVLQSGENKA